MVFDSLNFVLFFCVILTLYWTLPERFRIYLLLIGSYIFYSFNGLHVLPLIIASSILDFYCGHKISKGEKKLFHLWVSILGNLSLLGFYKYSAFLVENVNWILGSSGSSLQLPVPKVDFPIGISFFTFQTMAYTIDVYRQRIAHEKNFFRFSLFVSYFPQLVAGPLERAGKLLPQLSEPKFDAAKVPGAVLLITWGLFKKTIVADRLHWIIKDVFESPEGMYSGLHHVYIAVMIPIRFYCDFSGYCDIAIGCAALMGVQLTLNFHSPFWSSCVPEFWRRWHVTLYQWFRDYVYVLFENSESTMSARRKFIAVFTVFVLSGLWHGPSWTFVAWGALNGVIVIGLASSQNLRTEISRTIGLHHLPRQFIWVLCVFLTLLSIGFSCVFFQAHSMPEAISFLSQTKNNHFFPAGGTFFAGFHQYKWDALLTFIGVLLIQFVDLIELKKHRLGEVSAWPQGLVWVSAWGLALLVVFYGYENKVPFSYYYF